jgi:CMP-N-acetylneuraminic acid synthetase
MPTAVALVPARAGSQRVPGKNVLPLAGQPLIAYSIASAQESGIFTEVVVSTDSEEIADVARRYGASVPGLRPAEIATSTSSDIDWVLHVMRDRDEDAFAILRPTSPFRSAATIRRAWEQFLALGDRIDSLRAVEKVKQHPGKMWVLEGDRMRPLLEQPSEGVPFHSQQYAALPPVYVQNSSLELAWRRVLDGPQPSIAGERLAPFFTDAVEGFSIDYPEDVERAERLVSAGEAGLPEAVPGARTPDRA